MNNRFEVIYHPKTLTRQNSYFDLYDHETDDEHRYTFVKPLGAGTYGYVRLFEDDDGNYMAVKALKPKQARHLTKYRVEKNAEEIQSEYNFLQQAYPDGEGYSLHLFEEPDVEEPEVEISLSEAAKEIPETSSSSDEKSKPNTYIEGNPGIHASYRMTIPFIRGNNLCNFANEKIKHPHQMAKLMLRVAEECQRLHDAGVIHGDIGSRNILTRHNETKKDYHVQYIDFGMAYKINGYATVNFTIGKKITKSGRKISSGEMAPERYANRKLKAHPRQDVYSLAKTFNKMIKNRDADWLEAFKKQYPFIQSFITKGSDISPSKRPSLPDFIARLKNYIDCLESFPLNISQLITALEQDGLSAARKQLEAKSSFYTREKLAPVLYKLIKNGAYELAEKLMDVRKGIPLAQDVDGDHTLAFAAGDDNMDDYFFKTMLDYVPQNQLLAVVSKQNDDGESALKRMAASHRLQCLMEKIEASPKLMTSLAKIKISASTTRESVALHLLAYLSKLNSEPTDNRHHQFFKNNQTRNKTAVQNAVYCMIDKILMIDDENGDELDAHETIIQKTPYLSKLHQDLLANNLIGSPEAEEGLFGFLPRLWM